MIVGLLSHSIFFDISTEIYARCRNKYIGRYLHINAMQWSKIQYNLLIFLELERY